jgi:CheY-like chemotaxis protein
MDDESFVRQFLSEALLACGYEATCVRSGQEAIEHCREAVRSSRPFLFALLDLTIRGGQGGKEVCRLLKNISPGLVTIACSGYSDDPILARPEEFYFDAALSKPYKLPQLSRLLRNFLDSKK